MSLSTDLNIKSKSSIKVAIIYYSGSGNTKNVAEAVFRGFQKVPNVTPDLITAAEAIERKRELVEYDAYVFGSPTYFGSLAAKFKEFLEVTSHIFATRGFQDKLSAGFTNAASQAGDKQTALIELQTFATQQGLIWVPLGIPPSNNKSVRNEEVYNRAGFFSGLATQSYIDLTPDQTPTAADIRTAEFFGERLGKVFLQYYH